jgi:hypothetical protein
MFSRTGRKDKHPLFSAKSFATYFYAAAQNACRQRVPEKYKKQLLKIHDQFYV